jgi:hypothetical protein
LPARAAAGSRKAMMVKARTNFMVYLPQQQCKVYKGVFGHC